MKRFGLIVLLLLLIPAYASAHPGHSGGRPHYHNGHISPGQHNGHYYAPPVVHEFYPYREAPRYYAPRRVNTYVGHHGQGGVQVYTRFGSFGIRW